MVEQRTAELKSKNKELETFTYSVSHDLKAPLRGIDGYSQLLSEEYADKLDEEGLRFLKNIRYSTDQMTQLIEDLLTYSRIERRDLRSTEINIRKLIDELILEREHEISSRSVQVDVKIPIEQIVCDRDSMRHAMGNLLDNAIKFTGEKPQTKIEIGGEETPAAWQFWVRDNGVGFDPKIPGTHLRHISAGFTALRTTLEPASVWPWYKKQFTEWAAAFAPKASSVRALFFIWKYQSQSQ